MTRSIIWRSPALRELTDASLWYEEKQTGLGIEFVEAVQQAVQSAQASPQHFRMVDDPIRRALMKRFPYCLHFYERKNQPVVLSLHHTKRNPKIWKERRE